MGLWAHFAAVYRIAHDRNDATTMSWLAHHYPTFQGGTRTHLVDKLAMLLRKITPYNDGRAFHDLPGATLSAIECQGCFELKFIHSEFRAQDLVPGKDGRRCRIDPVTHETVVYKLRCEAYGGGFRL